MIAFALGFELDPQTRTHHEISGDPPAKVVFHGLHPTDMRAAQKRNPGMVATAIHWVSAIPFV